MNFIYIRMEGVVFDIQRFALHDGPGIRTTVFLKGCPLRCVWCCNPESQSSKPQLAFDATKCTGCGKCINICPQHAILEDGDKITIDFNACDSCGQCVEVCTDNALSIFGYVAEAHKIMHEVLKDSDYYRISGGGLTISGGEAMAQFDFTKELLKQAKQNHIHTVIETSGYADKDKFRRIMPFVDLFLLDIKLVNNSSHRKYAGVENRMILNNLDFLYHCGAEIQLRCPIIPGINDDQEHFRNLCELSHQYKNLKGIELLAYHDYGTSKYIKTGKNYELKDIKTVSKTQRENWYVQLEQMGCENLIR